jgi:4-aminobutyrate aminotransferase-like enzyme/Ser/Thr protein kinase RdoA (MazF antagonist)
MPAVTVEQAVDVARRVFGIEGSAKPLESERDRNFRISAMDGSFTLKFANPAEGPGVLSMQAAALEHLARVAPELPVPRNNLTVHGAAVAEYEVNGETLPVRMLTYLPGETLANGGSSPGLRRSIASTLGELGRALRGFFHPAAGRVLLWDLSHLERLRPRVADVESGQRDVIEHWLDRFERFVSPSLPRLRGQVIHNDFNPDNLLADPADPNRVGGIIDFGDMTHAPLIVDLAVAIAYQLHNNDDPADVFAEMVGSYHQALALESAELDVLPDLVAARLVQSLVIGAWRAKHHPDNVEYILSNSGTSWATLQRLSSLRIDNLVSAAQRACFMPTPASAPRTDLGRLLERRRTRLGEGMRLSYDVPLHAVAAEGVWLVDADDVRHLDAYNNVPHVGHSHPAVTAAIARQSAVLNTNTRYLVESVLEYADRLTSLLPDGLDVAVFANSGSEANDLAWRMARTVTGNDGFIVTDRAYHGSTYLTINTSPEELGIENLQPWVATIPAPDHRRMSKPEIDRAVARLHSHAYRPAAVAFDTIFSSDGIFEAPLGFLSTAAEEVRATGGLFIADEIQAGFGRVGERMWGFAKHDVVPDIVTLGKPMGNGHPIAAVVTTSEIAAKFSRAGYFFSTFAGNPVSTAAAGAVLDVMAAEGLPIKADRVGSYMRSGLVRLAHKHAVISSVRGLGMFIGVELSHNDIPGATAARYVMNEMRNRRVLIGRTGPHGNVLKIRPPLAFDESHADLLVSTLDEVLTSMSARDRTND